MAALARVRPVFHGEADFQHAFAWEMHIADPSAKVRLETRPRPGIRLDLLASIGGFRIAIEFSISSADLWQRSAVRGSIYRTTPLRTSADTTS